MKVRKLLAGFLSAAMVLGTMAFPAFAENETYTVNAANTLDDVISQINTSARGDVVINLDTDATLQLPDYYANLVNDDVTSLTINGNDHTLDVDATYRLKFNMAGTLKLNNVTVKSDYLEANTWDSWDFLFNCDVEFTNVIFNREMALEKNAVLTGVTINNSSTDDSYAIWIPATQKTVVMDNVTINAAGIGKRGIKIDEQYINKENIGVVDLTVKNSTFNTYKKSAILVKSKAGANIVASNNNIENVNADTTNLVWVDSDLPASYPKVKVTIDGEPVAPYLEGAGTGVACIGNSYYMTLTDALDAAQDGDTIILLSDEVTMPDNTVISKPVTIKGNGKDATTIKVNNRVKIMSENVSFEDLKIDGSDVAHTESYTSVIYVGADNVSFKNVNFYEGPDGTYDANVQVGVNGHSLKFTGCDFSGAYRGVHIADCVCDTVFDDCVFNPGAYPFNVNTSMPSSGAYGEILVKNSTLMGWTSWSGTVKQVTFENCEFKPGEYNHIRAYNNTTFKNCSFTHTSVDSGNDNNFKWIIDNCTKNGEILRRSDQFFSNNSWENQEVQFIFPSEAKVIDTAKTTGAQITLDNLNAHENVDINEDATYKVVVSTAPAEDVAKANAFIKNNNDTNTSKAIFDISVKKVDSYGVETDLGGNEDHSVKNQQVTLTLGETPEPDTVKVYHVDSNGTTTEINDVTVNGKDVTFTAPSFSTYAATYTATPLAETQITNNIGVKFERIADTSSYNVVLKALDGKTINRFMSADLTFAMTLKEGAVDYTITPAANINLIDNGNGRYEFNLDGLTSSGATGTEITIGTVTFDGYG
ncbi:MAG: hypothetical protein PUF08_04270, partial [Clostridiales bacterium]|nr:hypothetical protein [Clostridiales bacterium]